MSADCILNFIDGRFVAPSCGNYLDSFDPSTGVSYVQVPDSSSEDVQAAYEAANKAFHPWAKQSRAARSKWMHAIADRIESRLEEFACAESKDQGKPITLAKTVDIPRAIYNFRYFAGKILYLDEKKTELDGLALNYVKRDPVGVVGLISPWNLPLYLLTWKIAPAIAAGNACVCKPSEITSMTAYLLCTVLKEIDFPAGVINMVFGTGPKVGDALVTHPKVPLISFTGGTATGELIMRNSARFCGKNANIIFEDANLDECLPTTVRSSFANQGEICLCGSRIFVHSSIYAEFLRRFVEATSKLVIGDPRDPKTQMGALVSREHLHKVLGFIHLAKEEGAQILFGGERPVDLKSFDGRSLEEGYFLQPTIIDYRPVKTTVHPFVSKVMQQEIFGPVVTVYPFENENEVVEFANGIEYGLSASIWTENGRRQRRVAEELKVGTVWVNCWMVRDLNMPFGGTKMSGVGREGGDFSIDFFTESKTICLAN